MKLYATVASERASKGQGGKKIDIVVFNEKREKIFEANMDSQTGFLYATTFGSNPQSIDTTIDKKGEKQKGKKQYKPIQFDRA